MDYRKNESNEQCLNDFMQEKAKDLAQYFRKLIGNQDLGNSIENDHHLIRSVSEHWVSEDFASPSRQKTKTLEHQGTLCCSHRHGTSPSLPPVVPSLNKNSIE